MGQSKSLSRYNQSQAITQKPLTNIVTTQKSNSAIETQSLSRNKITKQYSILLPPLGYGSFSKVIKIIHKQSGMVRALKIINKQKQSPQQQQALLNEVEIIKQLDHSNILKMYEFYQDDRRFYIVTELLTGGKLLDKICDNHFFGENLVAYYMQQILSGVAYCHKLNVVHRDIKPENLILESKKENANLKIIDFGTSIGFFKDCKFKQKVNSVYCVSNYLMAPEILTGNSNEKCDVWSCGVIMYILLYGFPPFQGKTDKETMAKIIAGKYTFPDDEMCNPSLEAKKLIDRMLYYDPSKRISAEQALNNEWISKYSTQLQLDNKITEPLRKRLQRFKLLQKFGETFQLLMQSNITVKEQRQELLKIYQTLDLNNDGILSRQELIEGYQQLNEIGDIEKDIESFIAIADNSEELQYSCFFFVSLKFKEFATFYGENQISLIYNSLNDYEAELRENQLGLEEDNNAQQCAKEILGQIDDQIWKRLLELDKPELTKEEFEEFIVGLKQFFGLKID